MGESPDLVRKFRLSDGLKARLIRAASPKLLQALGLLVRVLIDTNVLRGRQAVQAFRDACEIATVGRSVLERNQVLSEAV